MTRPYQLVLTFEKMAKPLTQILISCAITHQAPQRTALQKLLPDCKNRLIFIIWPYIVDLEGVNFKPGLLMFQLFLVTIWDFRYCP